MTVLARRPSVLLVARWYPPLVGGIENYLYNLYEHIADDVDVEVVTVTRDGEESELLQESKTAISRVSPRGAGLGSKLVVVPLMVRALIEIARTRPDQVHCGHLLDGIV